MVLGFFAVQQRPVGRGGREKKAEDGIDPSGCRALHAIAAGHNSRGSLDGTDLCKLDQW